MGQRPASDLRRFGCAFLQERPWPDLLAHCRVIEDAGFDSLWLADHLISYPNVGPMLEPWTTLAAIAATTSRIAMGTLVTNISYRNPVLVAKEAITVDHISNGRARIGIGAAGTRTGDMEIAGLDEWSKAERADRFDEFIEMIDGLTSGALESFEGRYYRTKGFERGTWPVQEPRPPLMIAAHGDRTLRTTARFADAWNGLAGWGRTGGELMEFLHSCNAKIDSYAAEAGRDPASIRRSVLLGQAGIEWWSSAEALHDLVGRLGDAGIQDVIFSYPSSRAREDYVTADRFMDVVVPAVAGLSSYHMNEGHVERGGSGGRSAPGEI